MCVCGAVKEEVCARLKWPEGTLKELLVDLIESN